MSGEPLFPAPRSRVAGATLGVLVAAVVMTAAMPAYLPFGQANSIVLPIIFFPVTWLLLFLWTLFAKRMLLVWASLVVLTVVNALIIANQTGAL
ncbi:MAG: hypothetical protein AAFZ58_11200 [Pseudomonadota bacterium]